MDVSHGPFHCQYINKLGLLNLHDIYKSINIVAHDSEEYEHSIKSEHRLKLANKQQHGSESEELWPH